MDFRDINVECKKHNLKTYFMRPLQNNKIIEIEDKLMAAMGWQWRVGERAVCNARGTSVVMT